MKWVSVEDMLPKSDPITEECSEKYLIYSRFGATIAMYLDNEWHASYAAKIICPVTHWAKIEKPDSSHGDA